MIVLKHSLFQHTTWMNEASHVLITLSTVVGRYIPQVTTLLMPPPLLYL